MGVISRFRPNRASTKDPGLGDSQGRYDHTTLCPSHGRVHLSLYRCRRKKPAHQPPFLLENVSSGSAKADMRSDGTPRCGPKLPRKVNRVTLIITNEDPAPNSSQGHEMTAIRPIAVVVKVTVAAWRTPRSHEVPQAWGGYGFHKSSWRTYTDPKGKFLKPP